MTGLNFCNQDNRIKWAQLWTRILQYENWNFSFFQVPEMKKWAFETELITDVYVNFHGDFFHNGKYMWPSSLENATLVVQEAQNYTNLYDLIISEPFNSNLNLHKSTSSLCEQNSDLIEENIASDIIFNSNFYYSNLTSEEYFNSLNLSTWPYEIVVISAICYLLENIYINYHKSLENLDKTNKTSVLGTNSNDVKLLKQNLSYFVEIFIWEIAVYLIDEKYAENLFSVLSKTHIFRIEIIATLKAFTDIFNKLSKKKYSKYLKNNNSIVKTLSRFFQVFQLNFIFCDSFIQDEIICSIDIATNSIYYSEGLLEILNIYKLFLLNYFRFKDDSKKLLYFNNPELEISNQKLFVNTFFYYYISDISYLQINEAVDVFKKLFPSIQFDILQYLAQNKKNENLKEKLNQGKNMVGITIGLTGPTLSVHHSLVGNSFRGPAPFATYATSSSSEAIPTQKGVVWRSLIDTPAGLRNKNFRHEQAQFKKYQQKRWEQFEKTFQQSTLSQRCIIIPQTPSKAKAKSSKGLGLVFIQDKKTGLRIPLGNSGSYDSLKRALKNSPISDGHTLKNAHFFCDQLRKACGVSRGDGFCWLVPPCINDFEEHQGNQITRNYSYVVGLETNSLSELVFPNSINSWKYISQTVESRSSLKSDTFDFLNKRYKTNVGEGIVQLDHQRVILQIPTNKSLHYLYSGHVLQEINHLTEIVKSSALCTAGQGQTLREPGEVISDACDNVYQLARLGKTYIAALDSLPAEEVFSHALKTEIYKFADSVNRTSQANRYYYQTGRENIPALIISFEEIPILGIRDPGISQIGEFFSKVTDIITNQRAGDLQEAFETGRKFGIGDFRTKSKPLITQTSGDERNPNENFCHIASTGTAIDYSNDERWVY